MQSGARAALFVMLAVVGAAGARGTPTNGPAILVEFFHEPGCPVCERVAREVLPDIESRFGGLYTLRRLDTGIQSNYLYLAGYQERLAYDREANAVVVVNRGRAFAGWKAIREQLPGFIEALVLGRVAAMEPAPAPAPATERSLADRVGGFTLLAVVVAGLTDGINPCAIATLVFFVSLLSVLKVRARGILVAGACFCAGSFLTYLAIGFGLLRALHLFAGFEPARMAIEWGMIAALLVLSVLSARDALRYRARHEAAAVSVKLPARLQAAIHRVLRKRLSAPHLGGSAFLAGCAVTALESVCTGQVYVPTLVLVLKSGVERWRSLALLLLYNTMFVIPLIVVVVLAYHGTRTERFLRWSAANVVFSKLLLAGFFLVMALLLLVL